jgi:hypothetical protein
MITLYYALCLAGIFVLFLIVKYLARKKLEKSEISEQRKALYRKSIRTSIGSLWFLFLKIK